MNETDELGPVDYLVIEFPAGAQNFTGEMAGELARLAETGTIRVLDLLVLAKDADGTVEAAEIDDLDALDELRALIRLVDRGLLSPEELEREQLKVHRGARA